ncbi:Uncharacterised protein [Corynebacterium diphtheriae]|nr:Uncharacterised protein [Corynebacterium diphtheriae]
MERVHDFDSLGQFLNGGCFEAGESVHRDDIDAITPVFRSGVQPLFEHLFRPSGHHVEQTCRACFLADGSQVDDDGDILVTAPGVPPDVFVDTNDADRLEPGRVDAVSSRCPCARIAEFAVCQDTASLCAITDTVSWSMTRARSAQSRPVREIFARGGAAAVVF